ncbi:hypothetical protein MTBUT4_320023 [Magnetospirillum sp. UT-4]|nr:hypothetical protein MTBUT4_320023 [Magnetospirillum sp. UT-4]
MHRHRVRDSWIPAFAGMTGNSPPFRRPRAGGDPGVHRHRVRDSWIPAFAGMTGNSPPSVVPAQAGTQGVHRHRVRDSWVPAFAGTTSKSSGTSSCLRGRGERRDGKRGRRSLLPPRPVLRLPRQGTALPNRRRIWSGSPYPLGASWDGNGVNFALFSAHAEKVELCLFDHHGRETERVELPGSRAAPASWTGWKSICPAGSARRCRRMGTPDGPSEIPDARHRRADRRHRPEPPPDRRHPQPRGLFAGRGGNSRPVGGVTYNWNRALTSA